jgi:hypothetical protein
MRCVVLALPAVAAVLPLGGTSHGPGRATHAVRYDAVTIRDKKLILPTAPGNR